MKQYPYGIETVSIYQRPETRPGDPRPDQTPDQETETWRASLSEQAAEVARSTRDVLAFEKNPTSTSGRSRKQRTPMRSRYRDFDKGYHLFTDGGCISNPGGLGGWAFIVLLDGVEVHSACGGERCTTNNRMELTAVIAALTWISINGPFKEIEVHSDSTYCVGGCNDWRHSWKKCSWLKSGSPIPNADLWRQADRLLSTIPLKLHWVRGHSGISGNVRADRLASRAISELKATSERPGA
jgi:ribonuclease HI